MLTNSWFSDATSRIASGLQAIVLPPPATSAEDQAALPRARRLYDQLRRGTLDRSGLTENANFYFTPRAQADYRTSLSALGEPVSFVQTGRTRLRGGFVNRTFRVTYPNRTLSVSTYAEPDGAQRFEQFLVAPVQ